jgi:hypothetical protein
MNQATAESTATRDHRKIWVSRVLTVVAAAAAIVTAMQLLAVPSVVDRITVENPTSYNVTIYVTDNDRDGWMAMGVARPEASSTFDLVIDQGQTWVFRFSADGVDDVELQSTRRQLVGEHWRLPIPAALQDE